MAGPRVCHWCHGTGVFGRGKLHASPCPACGPTPLVGPDEFKPKTPRPAKAAAPAEPDLFSPAAEG